VIDAVQTHPHDPALCGVVKFSQQLAMRLGVGFHSHLGQTDAAHPLVSVKGSEGDISFHRPWAAFDLFAHDATGLVLTLAPHAHRVYAANRVIADQLRTIRPDVVSAWCPSTIQGNATRGAYNVLTFGMAHKLQVARYEALKRELDAEWGDAYTVSVSTAVHEGSPWDATATVAERLRDVFGYKLRVLGYLADDALARELSECDAVALYFDPGVRENNTTYWAAVESGKPLYTNRDEYSPSASDACTWNGLTFLLGQPAADVSTTPAPSSETAA
jgi:hypothetical protein